MTALFVIPPNLTLPAPVFWGCLAAWAPLPPAVMAGILCATMVYALMHHLASVNEWMSETESDDPLLPINYLQLQTSEERIAG